jgi:TP901 family phage tail tape measure protein
MSTKVLFTFEAEDLGVAKKQDEIADRMKAIRKEIEAAKKTGSPYTDLLKESQGLKREQDELRKKQRELNKEFAATKVPKDSLAGLRLEYAKLIEQIKVLDSTQRNSDFGKNLINQAAKVKGSINNIEQSVKNFTGNVGNYRQSIVSIGDLVTGGLLTGGVFALFSGVAALGRKVIDTNSAVSDSIADVAKTTGATIDEINSLSDKLEGRATRTSLIDQLGIAKIGGQLGVAKEDLFGFVEAVDVVNVALGDQFGGGVEQTTDVIGKLRNVLTDIKSDNIGKDITNIGNALNYLESQGVASGGEIADFTGRIAGIGRAFDISSGKILGVSSTLAELGINAERGSTAFTSLVQRIGRSPEAFARAIDVPVKEFKSLVNDDIFGAVELFVSKLNDKNLSNTELASVLKSLKLTGAGVSEVVSKLGGNIGILDERVAQATKSITEVDSITNEYEKKNETLGASIDNLSNAFANLLTDGEISGFLRDAIQGAADFVNGFADASDKLFDFSAASSGASTANDILSDSIRASVVAIEKDSIATERNFNILKDNRATTQQRQEAIDNLVKMYPSLLTQQQLEAANIDQLNGLQLLSTNVLRQQITERLKLRAKEQLESEIIQKKLRQVEIDATPDRALLGELTSGETLRNFGTLDPSKLRKNLQAQFNKDIQELENGLKKVDQNFAALQRSAEDNLSAAEQDALDLFRQFNEGGKAATTSLKGVNDEIGKAGLGGGGSGAKQPKQKTENAVEGSLRFFREQIEKLKKDLEKTPTDIPLFNKLRQQIIDAELALQALQEKLDKSLDPADIDTGNLPIANTGITIPVTLEIQNEEKTANDLEAFAKRVNDKYLQNKAETDEKEAEAKKAKQEEVDEALQASAIDSAQTIADSVFQIRSNQLEKEQSAALEKLNTEEQAAIDAAQGNAAKEKLIREDFEKRRAALEKEGARKRKELAKKEALINTALAVTKALTGAPPPFSFILAGFAAIAGAAQLAVIDSQEFWQGGKVKRVGPGKVRERQNAPRTPHGDTVLAYLAPGEMVLNEGQQSRIQAMAGRNIFAKAGVPGYANATPMPHFVSGGVVGDIVPQTTSYAYAGAGGGASVQATFSDAQMVTLGRIVASEVAAQVGAEVRTGIGTGLNDANRRIEREQTLQTNRQG